MDFINEMFGMKGRTAVITGGGGAIAGALTEGLLKAGASVSLWDIKKSYAEEAVQRLAEGPDQVKQLQAVEVDTGEEESVAKAISETEERFSSFDVLINAAGGNRGKSAFVDTDMEQFDFVLRLNLIAGLMVPTKVVAKHWVDKGIKGAVINLASMASFIPLSGVWAYGAAKAGVMNLTMAAAKEFAPNGIRVNALAPGFFIGKQNRALLIDEKSGNLTPRGQQVIDRTPFARFGDVKELAGAALYLANNNASGFVTGITIPVDGGFLVDNI